MAEDFKNILLENIDNEHFVVLFLTKSISKVPA